MNIRLSHFPLRAVTGAYILNSGLTKLKGNDEETQKHLHAMATNAYPQLEQLDAGLFTKILGGGEVALGIALLAPVVSPGLAGAGLMGFSGALLGLYWKIPGMRRPGSILPTADGLALAKDSWMLGIGASLVTDALADRVRRAIPGRD
jgi:uncharacterized membrane protein YphA (DoxX/SURF4 family)